MFQTKISRSNYVRAKKIVESIMLRRMAISFDIDNPETKPAAHIDSNWFTEYDEALDSWMVVGSSSGKCRFVLARYEEADQKVKALIQELKVADNNSKSKRSATVYQWKDPILN